MQVIATNRKKNLLFFPLPSLTSCLVTFSLTMGEEQDLVNIEVCDSFLNVW